MKYVDNFPFNYIIHNFKWVSITVKSNWKAQNLLLNSYICLCVSYALCPKVQYKLAKSSVETI